MSIIYDSLCVLAPVWVIWIWKNFSERSLWFLLGNGLFFLISTFLFYLSLYVVDELFIVIVLFYIWILFAYFLIEIFTWKSMRIISICLGSLFSVLILYSLPTNYSFYRWSYWEDSWVFRGDEMSRFERKNSKVIIPNLKGLVKCELVYQWSKAYRKKNKYFSSDRDTITKINYKTSYKYKGTQIDKYDAVLYAVPNAESEIQYLFNRRIKPFWIVSVNGKPVRFIDQNNGDCQELMANYEFYEDFLVFKWENEDFWQGLSEAKYGSKTIHKLEKCR